MQQITSLLFLGLLLGGCRGDPCPNGIFDGSVRVVDDFATYTDGFGETVVSSSGEAFRHCFGISQLTIGSGNTSLSTFDDISGVAELRIDGTLGVSQEPSLVSSAEFESINFSEDWLPTLEAVDRIDVSFAEGQNVLSSLTNASSARVPCNFFTSSLEETETLILRPSVSTERVDSCLEPLPSLLKIDNGFEYTGDGISQFTRMTDSELALMTYDVPKELQYVGGDTRVNLPGAVDASALERVLGNIVFESASELRVHRLERVEGEMIFGSRQLERVENYPGLVVGGMTFSGLGGDVVPAFANYELYVEGVLRFDGNYFLSNERIHEFADNITGYGQLVTCRNLDGDGVGCDE